MGLDGGMHSLQLTLQVFFLDILLSGDNAIVIALACRRLPAQQMRLAILIGTGAAIGLRILFTTIITFLLAVPFLKLLGMLALIVISIKLLIEEDNGLKDTQEELGNNQPDFAGSEQIPPASLWATIVVIVVADATMSLDNVVALAAIAQNSVFFLVMGLVLSVPLLMYGSLFVTTLLKRYPILIPAGGALLGWVAGDIGMSDPLIADWVTAQLPGLRLAVPPACAIFVLLESKIVQKNRLLFLKPRPITVHSVHEIPIVSVTKHRPKLPLDEFLSPVARILPVRPLITMTPSDDVGPLVEASGSMPASDRASVVKKRTGIFAFFFERKGVPYLLVSFLALPVLGVIGSIVYNGVMPMPSQLIRYECPGYSGPFSFYFRHGKDNVQIRSSSGRLEGVMHSGKIEWANFSGDTAILGFTPPMEITWDDAKSIHINGGSFSEVYCLNKELSTTAK